MKKNILFVFLALFISAGQLRAQQKTITGKITSAEDNGPLPGVSVKVKGSSTGVSTDSEGIFSIRAAKGQTLVFSSIGFVSQEKTIGDETAFNMKLQTDSKSLDEVVVTALGQKAQQRSIGTAQQTVKGADIAQTQRENFLNSLQGRVAGVEVTSSSGVPGASSSITIRGVSSISGSNQPLFIVDGLPIDNKTLNTSAFVSDASSATSLANRTTDFTNRAADINPQDIESITVLKGPEAAALYGIDAANGAIIITTKRGKAGNGALSYSNSFRIEKTRAKPEIQSTYGIGVSGLSNSVGIYGGAYYTYFGAPYPAGTRLYDNIDGFFQTALTQRHNLSLDGGTDKVTYRISTSYTNQNGVVPNSAFKRLTLNGSAGGQVNKWLKTDLSITYSNSDNDQPFKGAGGPLMALLTWPQTDDAKNYLTPAGTRRILALSTLGASEVDNPYFNVNKNQVNSKTNRATSNLGLTVTPFSWVNFKTNVGIDAYTSQNLLLRHPESAAAFSRNGILDIANDITRNINMQNLLNFNKQKVIGDLYFDATLGHALQDWKSNIDAGYGENFLDPNFVSLNNTQVRLNRTTITQRRLVSFFGRAQFSYHDYLFLTGTLRNDRTSTIPEDRYSFYYPSVSTSFVFTDVPAFSGLKKVFTSGRIRAAYAEVGRDARPYAYVPSLENKLTVGGGYGYGFTGPNLGLKPEFAKSYEFGADLSFFDDRFGIDATVYRKETSDQIVNDIRGSYATGFILFNLNGARTRNQGLEMVIRGTPVKQANFNWNVLANFESARGKILSLPNSLPESYVSDTWLYGNVRNGGTPGQSTRSLTGLFYLRNRNGDLLINPQSGLPVRSTTFIDGGYDRQPKFTIGLTNTFTYKDFSLSFLLDFRKGGDVFNGTQSLLTNIGLAPSTLDRNIPRIIGGVLQDGRENTDNPTRNTIAVNPSIQNAFYTSMSEELFIEKNINWMRLRDVTLRYQLPARMLQRQNFIKTASVFFTGTDLFLLTNYSGLDPIVNGNSAAVGGSGGAGIDFGNFPIPRGLNFGVSIGL